MMVEEARETLEGLKPLSAARVPKGKADEGVRGSRIEGKGQKICSLL